MREVGSEREALAGACVEDGVLDVIAGEPGPEEQHGAVEEREQERAERKRLEHGEHAQKHRRVRPVPPLLVVRQALAPGHGARGVVHSTEAENPRPRKSGDGNQPGSQMASHRQHANEVPRFAFPVEEADGVLDHGGAEEAIEIETGEPEEE